MAKGQALCTNSEYRVYLAVRLISRRLGDPEGPHAANVVAAYLIRPRLAQHSRTAVYGIQMGVVGVPLVANRYYVGGVARHRNPQGVAVRVGDKRHVPARDPKRRVAQPNGFHCYPHEKVAVPA